MHLNRTPTFLATALVVVGCGGGFKAIDGRAVAKQNERIVSNCKPPEPNLRAVRPNVNAMLREFRENPDAKLNGGPVGEAQTMRDALHSVAPVLDNCDPPSARRVRAALNEAHY
jgi:hypothetical protein